MLNLQCSSGYGRNSIYESYMHCIICIVLYALYSVHCISYWEVKSEETDFWAKQMICEIIVFAIALLCIKKEKGSRNLGELEISGETHCLMSCSSVIIILVCQHSGWPGLIHGVPLYKSDVSRLGNHILGLENFDAPPGGVQKKFRPQKSF